MDLILNMLFHHSNQLNTQYVYEKSDHGLPSQNGICIQDYYFWLKNDDKSGRQKNIFEIYLLCLWRDFKKNLSGL
jgi:hypothetical protein